MSKLTLQDIAEMIYSEDDYDYSDSSKFKNPAKECLACHKVFYPEAKSVSLQKFCRRSYYIKCVVCGEPVFQKTLSTTKSGLHADSVYFRAALRKEAKCYV